MWIAILIWFLIIIAILVAVLLLARAESHDEKFSASIPDGVEYEARQERLEEERRSSARIVAPGIVIQPSNKVAPGATEQPARVPDHPSQEIPVTKPVVSTSRKVVEVKGILQPRRTAPSPHGSRTAQNQSQSPHPVRESQSSQTAPSAQGSQTESVARSVRPTVAETTQVGMRPLKEKHSLLTELPLPKRKKEEASMEQTSAEDVEPEGSASLAHLVSKTEAKEASKQQK
ncbi:MAG: hypothetical protein LKJ44_05865 [Bifidobacteriaceae bacterium]|nr:hypothetical protein [Bifidobacteriaceae bacterium]MCI1979221.1 hypothetical protein [Bifidobacteriaceae bacterium]